MSITRRLLTRDKKRVVRLYARRCWIDSDGNVEKSRALARQNLSTVGSILTLLLIGSAILQICYTLFRFWRDMQVSVPPLEASADEPRF